MYGKYLISGALSVLSFYSFSQIPELEIIKENDTKNLSVIEIARQAYFNGNYQVAEVSFFQELEKDNFEPIDYLYFANTLNKDDKPALAKEFYESYFELNGEDAKQFRSQKKNILNKESSNIFLSSIEGEIINPTIYSNKVVGTQNGKVMSFEFDCDQNIGNPKEEELASKNLKISSVSYFNDSKSAVVSAFNSSTKKYGLYLFNSKKNKWKSPVKLLENKKYNYVFPYVDEVSKIVYFSSDMDGGYGGYDIYKSILTGSNIEEPFNLGSRINTPGNEICPIKDSKWLYFSSNGFISKGGYDIIRYSEIDNGNFVIQNFVELNTIDDDFSILPLSQNRFILGHTKNKEYNITTIQKNSYALIVEGHVFDDKNQPIADAVLLIDSKNQEGIYAKSDKNGYYSIVLDEPHAQLKVQAIADGYETLEQDILKEKDFNLSPIIPEVVVYNQEYKTKPPVNVKQYKTEVVTEPTKQPVKTNKPYTTTVNYNTDLFYYIIIGSTTSRKQAEQVLDNWLSKFDDLQVIDTKKGMYRVGFYAGTNEREAMAAYNKAKNIKSQVWILRP